MEGENEGRWKGEREKKVSDFSDISTGALKHEKIIKEVY